MCGPAPDTLTIEVDLPPVELSPNGRVYRKTRAAAIKDYRQLVGFLAVAEVHRSDWKAPARARLSLLFGMKDSRRSVGLYYHPKDADNALAASKALIDGLRDAGVIKDDNWASLKLGDVDATFEEGPWVRVTVERV